MVKYCEICGTTEGKIVNKNNKFNMFLCVKHYNQLYNNGKILDRINSDPNKFILHDDYAEMCVYNRENEEVTKVKIDLDDISRIKQHKWCIGNTNVVSRINSERVHLTYFIIDKPKHLKIIFRNNDYTDFRKANLLIATPSQKQMHTKIFTNNKSGFKGVRWDKNSKKWYTEIFVNKKRIYLGRFINKQDAISARKDAEEKYCGEFAYDETKDVTLNKNK